MDKAILARLERMEVKYKRLKRSCALGIAALVIVFITVAFKNNETVDVIRAKGIVIEDKDGRDRILIGAPIPYSKDRVRTDTALVRKYWAGKFKNPDQYMGWYKAYKNSADGMVVMNDKGFDIVQVGDDLSDANVGKRMFRSSGILWNTQEGWERGGAGVNTTGDGKSRPTIGLDDDSGEAMHMVCLEDGSKGFIIAGENGSIRIGMAKKEGALFQSKGAFTGAQFFDAQGKLVWEQVIHKNEKPKQ